MTLGLTWDWSSWYATLLYVLGGIVLVGAFITQIHGLLEWARAKLGRGTPDGATPEPPKKNPIVTLGHPSAHISLTPMQDQAEGESWKVIKVEPIYLIENKDPLRPIRDVTTGVRHRDGREHAFDSFHAQLIGLNEKAPVQHVGSIRLQLLDGVHEATPQLEFLYWVRFEDDEGHRWKLLYDPATKRIDYAELPQTNPRLDARVRRRDRHSYLVEIENSGDVDVEEVECVLPGEVTNWQLLTEVLPSYPIRVLEPGDSAEIPLVVALGPSAAVEAIIRGKVEGVRP